MLGSWRTRFGAWTVGVVKADGRSLGTAVPLHKQVTGDQFAIFEFKSLKEGDGISISDDSGEVTVETSVRGIDHMQIDDSGHLIVYFNDNTDLDLGLVRTPPGIRGEFGELLQSIRSIGAGVVRTTYGMSAATAAISVTPTQTSLLVAGLNRLGLDSAFHAIVGHDAMLTKS